MDKFIDASLGDAAPAFRKLYIPFKRKVQFAAQLHRPPEVFADLWKKVLVLNELRNLIAHNPEAPNLEERCAAFVKSSTPQPPASIAPDAPSRLVFAIGSTVAAVAGRRLGREVAMRRLRQDRT